MSAVALEAYLAARGRKDRASALDKKLFQFIFTPTAPTLGVSSIISPSS